jgi:hypothetical protein
MVAASAPNKLEASRATALNRAIRSLSGAKNYRRFADARHSVTLSPAKYAGAPPR